MTWPGLPALGVVPVNVVDEDRHRGQAVERGVWSPLIVEAQSTSEGTAALSVGADPQPSCHLHKDHRLGIGLGVVGQAPLDPHPVVGEEAGRFDQEPGRGAGLLVSQDRLKATRERPSTAEWRES
jgi:hypothetical protein